MINSLLHETIIRDIVDAASDIRDTVDDVQRNTGKSISSIAKASSDLVLVFPFMCDSTVSLETASMTAKAIERQCVTMLRLLFSSCQIGAVDNGIDFIKQFHTNIKTPLSLDDFMGYMDNMVESGQVTVTDTKTYNAIREEIQHLYDTLPDNINESSLSDAVVLERFGNIEVIDEGKGSRGKGKWKNRGKSKKNNAERAQAAADSVIAGTPNFDATQYEFDPNYLVDQYGTKANRMNGGIYANTSSSGKSAPSNPSGGKGNSGSGGNGNSPKGPSNNGNNGKNNQSSKNQASNYNRNEDKMYKSIGKYYDKMAKNVGKETPRNVDSDILHDPARLAQFYKNMMDAESNRMIDSDVKKANELVPTMMVVNFISKDPELKVPVPATFTCGVKCRLIPVDPTDIADRILVKHADKNVLLSFIKATTRETSFIKDFLFAIDKAKIDAVSQSRRGSSNKMWKVLERRAVRSKWNRAFSHPNDASMITTLGISQELAEYIKKTNGIDLMDPRVVRPIMEGFNLMGFVIIDEAAEADKFLWDTGEGYYETISFNNLEREASGGEYKKALNLMQKMYR